MATNPNVLTNEDILREMQSVQSQQVQNPQNPPPLPTVKIGDKDVPLDPVQLQAALTEYDTRTRSQLSEFKEVLDNLSQKRVDVNTEQPQQTVQQTTTAQPIVAPPVAGKRKTAQEWADDFVADPTSTIANTLGDILGAPGANGGELLKGALQTLIQNQQRLALENQALLESQKQLDARISESAASSAAKNFLERHPEYEASDTNSKVIRGYLEQYSLNPTEDNLDLVYAKAVADGRVKVKQEQTQVQQPQFNQQMPQFQPQQPQLQRGVPSLRGGASFSVDDQYLIDQSNKMSTAELGQLIERLKTGQMTRF